MFCILLALQTTPEDPFVSADALLNRISHPPSVCDQLQYLEPDLAEKNPPIFAQKLQVCNRCLSLFLASVFVSSSRECRSQKKGQT